MSRSQPGQRAATQETRSIRKARYLPALSSSSCSDTNADGDGDDEEDDPSAVPPENPIDPLRRVNVMLQFLGAGAIALGCEPTPLASPGPGGAADPSLPVRSDPRRLPLRNRNPSIG